MEDCSTDCAEALAHGQLRRRSDRGAMTDAIARVRSARTLLFVPGCQPERFDKAAAVGPDIVLIDLEDAVAPADKSMARDHARAWLNGGREAAVRINAIGTTWHEDDLEMVSRCGATVMLPKADSAEQVIQVLDRADRSVVIPLIETAAGITSAVSICAVPGVQRVAFGSIDLATQLGIDPLNREALLVSRSMLVLASAAANLAPPIDGVTTSFADPTVTLDDFRYALRLGMTAKLCIHPSQVPTVHQAARPAEDEIAWAKGIVARADPSGAAIAVGGQMIDGPVLERAKRILASAS